MDESKRSGVTIIRWALVAISFAVLVVILLVSFSRTGKKAAEEQADEKLISSVSVWSEQIRNEIDTLEDYSAVLNGYMEDRVVYPEDPEIIYLLKSIVDNTVVSKALVSKDGVIIATEEGQISDGSKYYLVQNLGKKETECRITGDPVFGEVTYLAVGIPLRLNRSVIYLIDLNELSAYLRKYTFNDVSFLAMIDRDGVCQAILPGYADYDSKFLNSTNFLQTVSKGAKNTDAYNLFKVKMYNGVSNVIDASYLGDNRTIAIAKVEKTDFYLVYGVRQYIVDVLIENNYEEVKGAVARLSVVFFVFAFLITTTMIVTTIKNRENSRKLADKADTDLLTDLTNKAATERKIAEYIDNNPQGRGIMFILDIDNFKKINDTMGHVFGDLLLKTLGKEIKAEFRVTDVVGRTGGDEFMVFLKDIKDDLILEREANRLVRFFHDFKAGDEYVKYSATASIGAAIFPDDAKTFKDLYIVADQALYRAKKRGKNQLVFYNEEEHNIAKN